MIKQITKNPKWAELFCRVYQIHVQQEWTEILNANARINSKLTHKHFLKYEINNMDNLCGMCFYDNDLQTGQMQMLMGFSLKCPLNDEIS